MGKRAECRPDVSSKLLDMVKEAKATVGKAARFQASPARTRVADLQPAAEVPPAAPCRCLNPGSHCVWPAYTRGYVNSKYTCEVPGHEAAAFRPH